MNLHVALIMASLDTIKHTDVVSHVVLSVPVREGNYDFFLVHTGRYIFLSLHFLLLSPLVPLVPVPPYFHKPLLKKLKQILPVFTLT